MRPRRRRLLIRRRWPRLRALFGGVVPRTASRAPRLGGMFLRRTWETRRGGVRRWLALSAVAWAVFSLVGGEHGWLRERELRAERDRQEERVRALRTEIASVRHDLEVSKEDPIGRERFLRERLGLARPGETVYRWVDPSAGDAVLDRPQSAR